MSTYDLLDDNANRFVYCIFKKHYSSIKKVTGMITASSLAVATSRICKKHNIPNRYIDRDHEGSEVGIKYVRKSG